MGKKKKAVMGRPRLPANEKRTEKVQTRFTVKERELLERKAEKDGLTLSEWIRKRALED
ncbi:MAG: hypothetical protein AAF492_22860 [Verrucomicrobiota bacterium]